MVPLRTNNAFRSPLPAAFVVYFANQRTQAAGEKPMYPLKFLLWKQRLLIVELRYPHPDEDRAAIRKALRAVNREIARHRG